MKRSLRYIKVILRRRHLQFSERNIVKSFFLLSAIALVLISSVSATFIYFFQYHHFYKRLADDFQVNIEYQLKKNHQRIVLSSKDFDAEDVRDFMESLGLVSLEIYNHQKKMIYQELIDDPVLQERAKQVDTLDLGSLALSKKFIHDFVKLSDDELFLLISYPISHDRDVLGYMKGIRKVDFMQIDQFRQGLIITLGTVLVTIVLFSMMIFILIDFAYRKLRQRRYDLLKGSIVTINTLGKAIALKDNETDAHNYRVTLYAARLAERLNLKKDTMKMLIIGSLLHDIGKIGIPDKILLKEEMLTADEYVVMQGHVLKGVETVEGNRWLEHARDVILCHHECYDGSGYPKGLSGDMIPLIARIFSIVDVFDALTSKRPYKEAFSYEQSLQILKEGEGSRFDPAILETFIGISKTLYLDIYDRPTEILHQELDRLIQKYILDNPTLK